MLVYLGFTAYSTCRLFKCLFVCLFVFYGISTLVGNLNVCLGFTAYQHL